MGFKCGIVGLPNVGKSTLFNRLSGASVDVADKLFATVDPTVRKVCLPDDTRIVITDTVGFIRNLPHRLITSFKATLEEARQTSLLLHVADATNPEVINQIAAVNSVLHDIGLEEKDTLLALNKVDMLTSSSQLDIILQKYPNAIPISASTRLGLEQLALAELECQLCLIRSAFF